MMQVMHGGHVAVVVVGVWLVYWLVAIRVENGFAQAVALLVRFNLAVFTISIRTRPSTIWIFRRMFHFGDVAGFVVLVTFGVIAQRL